MPARPHIIEARWILPVLPARQVLERHAVLVEGSRIVALAPIEQLRAERPDLPRAELPAHVLLPGLINAHTHAGMTMMRGLADDLPLMDWLQQHIWPAEGMHGSAAFVHDGTALACAEMLCGGITCFNDMYFYPDAAAAAASTAGIRMAAGIVALEFPTPYAADAQDYLRKGLDARDALRDEPLVHFSLAPHAPYTVGDDTFRHIAMLAGQLDLPIHIHVHETAHEVAESLATHGRRPLERLDALGITGPGLAAVHAVHLSDSDIALLARHGASVVHCPTSNLKLASGIARTRDLIAAGVNVALGTDSAASNNRLDLWSELRLAALLAKGSSGDATAIDAHQALAMATINGARALGLAHLIGSLEPGKMADLCAVRLDDFRLQPRYDIASHLVYVAGREHVSDVWVGGVRRVTDGTPQCDIATLLRQSATWQNRLQH